MKSIISLVIIISMLPFSVYSVTEKNDTLKVLQLNLWGQGETVPNGVKGIVDIIDQTDPDIAFLCEIFSQKEKHFMDYLTSELKKRGKQYYGENLKQTMGVLSKVKMDEVSSCFILADESRPNPVCKATISLGSKKLIAYSVHWDWTHYECYLPRGYSGTTWKKLPAPVNDADSVLAANRISFRDEGVKALLEDAGKEIKKGNLVILGGDFNEPSHLDWQQNTKDMRDHNGLVINWDCSVLLYEAGFKDVYREIYPDAVTHPGFTFPAGNKDADLNKLVWLPDMDERDRIDFIYYYPDPSLSLDNAVIVGPSQNILKGEIIENDSEDQFIKPTGIWPSDHKGMFSTFLIKNN